MQSGRHGRAPRHIPSAGEPMVRVLPTERLLAGGNDNDGSALNESPHEIPPVIKRAEVVAIALVILAAICVTGVLYVARGFFLPIVMAFVVGTMLSPAANFLERYRVPRGIGAVVIVIAVAAGLAFIIGLISAPV